MPNLDRSERARFHNDGFLKLSQAAPESIADECRTRLWEQIGLSPADPSGWSEPVVWAADQEHHGTHPRVMAQMPIILTEPLGPDGPTLPAGSVRPA